MEQEPNYGRQREPGDERLGRDAEQQNSERSSEAETSYNETNYGDPDYGSPDYETPDYGSSGYGDPDYGQRPYGDPRYGGSGMSMSGAMSPQDEKTWSIISHLSVLAGLIGLMPLGALVIWLIYRDRSPRVRFHAVQSLWYQLAWLGIWIVGAILGAIFSIVTLGIGAIIVVPLGFVFWAIPMIHGCYAAYKISQGEDFRYPFVADKIDGGPRTY